MASLYRKWRSRSFDDLLGQEHVVRTLRNAVRRQRVAHAYLFTGPRGTGKTSTARILARAVNCLNLQDGNPCNACATCLAAQEGRALDVIEIDAASNTSVDNVRDLREKVAYASGEGQYKVYIIDEVHRLSGAAFDAFLKTLEEPPPHVIFVFASTEPHKVPATIASRCQRFDFRRIAVSTSVARLREVAEAENLTVSDEVLQLLAYSANGSLRDALGLLDQVAAFESGGEITQTVAREVLGLADPEVIGDLAEHLIAGDLGSGLRALTSFVDAGGDPKLLMAQFTTYFRALLHRVTGSERESVSLAPGMETHLARQAAQLDESKVLAVLRAMTGPELSPKYDLLASLPFEMAYAQAALALQGAPAEAVREIATGSRPETSGDSKPSQIREVRVETVPRPPSREPMNPPAGNGATALSRETSPDQRLQVQPDASNEGGQANQASGNGSTPPAETENQAGVQLSPTSDVDRAWVEIVQRMRDQSKVLQALLRSAYLLGAEEGSLTVGFLHDFHREQVNDVQKRRLLERVASDVLGSPYQVKCVHTTKEEVAALRSADAIQEDDGFVEEAAERLRQYYTRQMTNGSS